MKRRDMLRGIVASPMLAMARPESLTSKKAVFEEVGPDVLMTLALPNLISSRDAEALKSIDSGFDTTLRYSVRLWEHGTRNLVSSRVVIVKVRRDPWKKRYVVSTRGAKGWAKRFFEKREGAIAAATTLARQRVASVDKLERTGEGPYYFVEVLAMRNPLEEAGGKRGRSSGRGGGRDLEWFSRLVDVLAGERARAEKIVHVRTNPFFLVP